MTRWYQVLAAVAALLLLPALADAGCRDPHQVRGDDRVVPAAFAGALTLQWLDHASFLLTSSRGTRVVTDPFIHDRPGHDPLVAELVTLGCLHAWHNHAYRVAGAPRVVAGVTDGGQTFVPLDRQVRDIRLYTVRLNHFRRPEHPVSAAFVFDIDDVCVAHLGDGGEMLSDEQIRDLGKVDVLLLPIGGGPFSMSAETAQAVVERLRPKLVLPMHYLEHQADALERFLQPYARVVRPGTDTITVAASTLPRDTTIMVLDRR